MQAIPIQTIEAMTDAAIRHIPPAWPLSATVAVNPFLGQTNEPLQMAAARLERMAGGSFFPPRSWFAEKISCGDIDDADLSAALAAGDIDLTVEGLRKAAFTERQGPAAIPLVCDLAAQITGRDWNGVINERISLWAGTWFDEGQALWVSGEKISAWMDWKGFAAHDLTPEIAGLRGFAAAADSLPNTPADFIREACLQLGLPVSALPSYFHALLLRLGGWSQMARYRLWQSELSGGKDTTPVQLLAIRLFWEVRLFEIYKAQIGKDWDDAVDALQGAPVCSQENQTDALLLRAAELGVARKLDNILSAPMAAPAPGRPCLQAAFCIDVRSEVFRRNLEALTPAIETIGFAGFFGLTTSHSGFASDLPEHRLPVLLANTLQSTSASPALEKADRAARYRSRAGRAWGRFRQAAVSSFAFVEAAGPFFSAQLAGAALKIGHKGKKCEPAPKLTPAPDAATGAGMAASILRAMSLTGNFAPLVILAGHGADTQNNPHNSALHCGACGGYSGEVNARLLAGLLNDRDIRRELLDLGIVIPEDTFFVGGLHNTTTDEIRLYTNDYPGLETHPDLDKVKGWLEAAAAKARIERSARLPGARHGRDVFRRSKDWAETRPEWGLAGCKTFIAAPRHMTRGRDLSGEAFLHSYDWQRDEAFGILELILTAPVVVASWISLQYFGSCVRPDLFGAGNKVLHNVIGGFGVLEGNAGLLRTGLPIQSVHDGDRFVHEPVRLTIVVAAPREAIDQVLLKHPGVGALFDNEWLRLYTLGDDGRLEARYCPGHGWAPAHWTRSRVAEPVS